MVRSDILELLIPVLRDQLIVCNIGLPSQELHQTLDQESNFYMLGTMGLASSIGLGVALVQNRKVIAIAGDGSVLTNLGTLATIGNNPTPNLVLLVIDNGSYGSTGDQPTYAGGKTSLTKVASACGSDHVVECSATDVVETMKTALAADHGTVIICKCESGNIKVPVITMDPVVIKDRFMKTIGNTQP